MSSHGRHHRDHHHPEGHVASGLSSMAPKLCALLERSGAPQTFTRGSASLLLAAASVAVLAVGCRSAGRTALWQRPVEAMAVATSTTANVEVLAEARSAWAERDDKERLLAAIAEWEAALEGDPSNAELLLALARAHYFLADGHLALEPGSTQRELEIYQKGTDYGERALVVLDPAFGDAMRAGEKFETAAKAIDPAGLAAAYWYSVNVGRFASKKGLSARLYYKDKVKAVMDRILEVDPSLFHGGADRYLGAFFVALPVIAGKNVERARKHFAAALELAPYYLPTKVVMAQFLAVELDDQSMYRALLEEVLAAPDTEDPDMAPENRAAKRTARKMLDEIRKVF